MVKMNQELIPPSRGNGGALFDDNPPPMNIIKSWYSGIREDIDRVLSVLKNFLRDCASDELIGTDLRQCARNAVTQVMQKQE